METRRQNAFIPHRGFTLVELLVVIAIIGVLVALLLPAVQAAREAARRSQCLNNLRQMSLGLLNYESARGAFPPAFEFDESANPPNHDPATLLNMGPNWAVRILPYIEQNPLYDQIDFTRFMSDFADDGRSDGFLNANAKVRATPINSFLCPSDPYNSDPMQIKITSSRFTDWARGNYAVNAGNGPPIFDNPQGIGIHGPDSDGWNDDRIRGAVGPNVSMPLRRITDGLTNTILVGEIRAGLVNTDQRGAWAHGSAGTSVLFHYGTTGDCNGPNADTENADDIRGCSTIPEDLMRQEPMHCDRSGSRSNQSTPRSTHPGGVNLGMADGSSHFVSEDIDTEGSVLATPSRPSPWDKLISSADGFVIDESPF